jgi:RimJ/RimL family protein N-acetyltransferase
MASGWRDRIRRFQTPLSSARLATERIDLRPPSGADAPAIAAHLADPEVTRWLARVPYPYRLADAVSFVEQAHLSAIGGSAATFALVPRDGDGTVVGIAVIHGLRSEPEFGYWLARSHWGRGLMGEAVPAVLAFAREAFRLPRIRSGAFVGNTASLAIQSRNGFVVTGTSHRLCLAEGRMKEHIDTVLEIEAPAPAAA